MDELHESYRLPSLWGYPVFRLLVAMAAGIVGADWLYGGLARLDGAAGSADLQSGMSAAQSGMSAVQQGMSAAQQGMPAALLWGLVALLGVFVVLMVLNGACSARRGLRFQRWFGVLAAVAFGLLGGLRWLQEEARVDFDWPEGRCLYVGEVMEAPVQKGKMMRFFVYVHSCYSRPSRGDSVGGVLREERLRLHGYRTEMRPVHRTVLLYAMPDSLQSVVRCGDRLLFVGKVMRPFSTEEITGFDYATYLRRRGVSGTAAVFRGEWEVLGYQGSLGLRQWALRCREWVVDRYRSWNLGDEEFAVVAALTVGDKRVLTDELKERYSGAGVSHVLALSGLHVGILSAILLALFSPLKRLRRGKGVQSVLVVAGLWAFAFLAGLSPSVVRAVMMCSLYVVSRWLTEDSFPVYTLSLAAFLMLAYQPMYVFDLSCQLSFLAVASILYFYPVIAHGWVIRNKVGAWLWNGMAVSVAAQLGTLPLILYYFGTFPTYFLLANLVVSVLAVGVLGGALVALPVSFLPGVGPLAVGFLKGVTWVLNVSVRWIQQLAGSQVDQLSLSAFQAVCGLVFLWQLYRFIVYRRGTSLACMLAALVLALAEWAGRPLMKEAPAVYCWQSHVYLKQHQRVIPLESASDCYLVDTLHIAVLHDDRWRGREVSPLIPADYLYLTRGFKGSLRGLLRVFSIRCVILDASLSDGYRDFLRKECSEKKIPCVDLSKKGFHRILL